MGESERRRRRLRPPSVPASGTEPPTDPPAGTTLAPAPPTVATPVPEAPVPTPEPPPSGRPVPRPTSGAGPSIRTDRPTSGAGPSIRTDRPTSGAGVGSDDREAERGLRGLVGSGSSQVSIGAALRARDAARPGDEHLAEAEEHLTIVRRNWSPREDLPRR